MAKTICTGCGLLLQAIEGPTHPYMLSSPACWKIYGEVLAREYSDKDYWSVHRLTVDAYAVQHPGNEDSRAIQSVSIHLASLYLIFEKNVSFSSATQMLDPLIKKYKGQFLYLPKPNKMADVTILDVWKAENAEQHITMVTKMAESTWQAWQQHHMYIRGLLDKEIG